MADPPKSHRLTALLARAWPSARRAPDPTRADAAPGGPARAAPAPRLPPVADRAAELEHLELSTRAIAEHVLPHTMTSVARVAALIDAVRHCAARDLPGALVECGVWRGGSVLAMILALQELGIEDREIWLYDTFEGMTEPTDADTSDYSAPARRLWQRHRSRPFPELFGDGTTTEPAVRRLLDATGYPSDLIRFVRGPVERTLGEVRPESIALLRLDTDWYESTRVELERLYPLLGSGGILIVDDYGHWDGCRRAVDEYFAATAAAPLLTRIDYTGRLAVKP